MWKWLKVPYEYLVLYGALTFFGTGGLIFTMVSALLYPVLPRTTGKKLGRTTMQILFRFFVGCLKASGIVKCDLEALDALKGERSVVIAPNHPCLLDAVLVISRLPDVVCIMKANIWDNIFLGGGARLAGYIRNDSPKNMIKLSADELREGHQLLVFPEGTRTVTAPVNGFKGGFALVARSAQARVQTVFIETNSPFLQKGWPVFRKPKFPLRYRAWLGEVFEPLPDEDVKDLVARLEAYYAAVLKGERPARKAGIDSRRGPALVGGPALGPTAAGSDG